MYAKTRKLAKRETPSKLTTIDDYFSGSGTGASILLDSSSEEEKEEEKEQSNSSTPPATTIYHTTLRLKRKKPNSSETEKESNISSTSSGTSPTLPKNSTNSEIGSDITPLKSGLIFNPQMDQSEGEEESHHLNDSSLSSFNPTHSIKLEPLIARQEEELTKISRIEVSIPINESALSSSTMCAQQVKSPIVDEELPTAFFATFKDETVLILHCINSSNCNPSFLISKIKSKFMDIPEQVTVKYWDDFVGGFVRFDKDVLTFISKSKTQKVKLLISEKL